MLGFLCWRAKLIRVWLGFWVYIYSFSFFQFLVLIAKVLNYLNTLFILMRKFKNICTILEFNVFVYVV